MNGFSKHYYLFLGLHSFLLGLFPFFIPVYLFNHGTTLAEISWFIAITGLGYSFALWVFDHYRSGSYRVPLLVSFALEVCLLILLLSGAPLPVIALVNGGYSCLYWTIQRLLFLAGGNAQDSGRRFGDFQIYVLVVLKAGVFAGSLLLENAGVGAVLLVSCIVGATGVGIFLRHHSGLRLPASLIQQRALSVRAIAGFADCYNSRLIFVIDGIFLYLESYFWLISLFLVVGNSFVRLGLLVIALAIILALLFLVIKNSIDRLDNQKVYLCSVILYIVSWVLRGFLSEEMTVSVQLLALLLVAFCTSFFRLAFNKRFFDTAEKSTGFQYILVKSYSSQVFLACGFGIIGLLAYSFSPTTSTFLPLCYWIAGIFAGLYLFYKPVVKSS